MCEAKIAVNVSMQSLVRNIIAVHECDTSRHAQTEPMHGKHDRCSIDNEKFRFCLRDSF